MKTNPISSDEYRQQVIDRFWETIPPIWNQVRNNLRAIADEKYGISVEQFHILRHIRKGITSISDLAAVKQISRPAISQAVDLLVERGLITRHRVEGDRRCIQLALTPDGDELLSAIFSENRAWMSSKLERMDPEDLNHMSVGLELLKKALVTAFE